MQDVQPVQDEMPEMELEPFLRRFTFDGTDYEMPSLGVAQRRAESEDELAESHETKEVPDLASKHRAKAAWWRNLENSSGGPTWRSFERDALCAIDALLAMGERDFNPFNNKPQYHLENIASHLLDGLHALAANGIEPAAEIWGKVLRDSATDFKRFALNKPELIQHWTRRTHAIPSVISPFPEVLNSNKDLLELLRVGELYFLAIEPKGKRGPHWQLKTPANRLAFGLLNQMDETRRKWRGVRDGRKLPALVERIANLFFFNEEMWERWAEVAWDIVMAITENHPEEHPALRPLGESAAKKKSHKGRIHPAANVRDKIKTRLREAIKLMASK